MGWQALGETVRAIAGTATAVAACFAAYIAYRGLEKWRAETIGKRRYDVAVNTLSLFYEMEEIIRSARAPMVVPHEMAPKEGVPEQIATDPNFAPEARLLEHQEFFAKFRAARHEFAAVFGKKAAEPFDELWGVRIHINHAVDFMLNTKELGRSRVPEDRKVWQQMYYMAFRHHDPTKDEITARVAAQIKAIEDVCRPVIAERGSTSAGQL